MYNGYVFKHQTYFSVVECANCGIFFAVPKEFEQQRREDHGGFHCPNKHSNYYPYKTESEKLKTKLKSAEMCCTIKQEEAKSKDYSARYWKGRFNKMKNEIDDATGVK